MFSFPRFTFLSSPLYSSKSTKQKPTKNKKQQKPETKINSPVFSLVRPTLKFSASNCFLCVYTKFPLPRLDSLSTKELLSLVPKPRKLFTTRPIRGGAGPDQATPSPPPPPSFGASIARFLWNVTTYYIGYQLTMTAIQFALMNLDRRYLTRTPLPLQLMPYWDSLPFEYDPGEGKRLHVLRQLPRLINHFLPLSFSGPEIFGAGGGKRMVNNKVKNKGTGGKSKVPRGPKPPKANPPVLSAGQTAAAQLVDEEPDFASNYPNFVYSAPPLVQKTFAYDLGLPGPFPGDGVHFEYDCLGAPFCGFVCIDVAMDRTPSPNNYEPQISNPDNPLLDGTFGNLVDYAHRVGCNLVLLDTDFALLSNYQVNPGFPTVWLVFHEGEDILDAAGNVTTPGDQNGHFVLMCAFQGSGSRDVIPAFPVPRRHILCLADAISFYERRRDLFHVAAAAIAGVAVSTVLLHYQKQLPDAAKLIVSPFTRFIKAVFRISSITSIASLVTLPYNTINRFAVGRTYRDKTDHNRRDVISSRDVVDRLDSYSSVCESRQHDYFGREIYRETIRVYEVSVSRFIVGYQELQALVGRGRDPSLCVATIGSLRGVNSDASRPNIIIDTMDLLKKLAPTMGEWTPVPWDRTTGYNTPPENIIIANPDRIQLAQYRGAGNMVVRYSLKEPKREVPVLVAPLGVLESDCGPVGPGEYPVTDSPMTLAAFIGRSMSAPEKTSLVYDFVNFSKEFSRKLVDTVDFSDLIEPDICEFFRQHYRGKKTTSYIDGVLSNYELHLRGCAPKSFYSGSLFVKDEDSHKVVDGKQYSKPRGIMVMSDLALIEQCPVLLLIDRFNHGPMSRFQVKDLSPEDMRRNIEIATDRRHNVTDYSSFEASVDVEVREIERFALLRLAERANFNNTAAALRRHGFGYRLLKVKWGVFRIGSRCSGDFWTSFGNGLVNLCLLAYCAHKRGVSPDIFFSHPKAIVEGDDGITPSEYPDGDILTSLGFKYSSEFAGFNPGDCDFLRSLWVDGHKILNVGRALKIFYCKRAARLKRSKQLYLLRCAALSLYHSSPGHPVLTSVVNRILKETVSVRPFRNYLKYLDTHNRCFDELKTREPIRVNEDMRKWLAKGAVGFPAVSINIQLELEHRITHDTAIYVGRLIDNSEDFLAFKNSYDRTDPKYLPTPGQGCRFLHEFVSNLG